MEYTEYRNDVLALCNFAEQVQIDLAHVTAEREQMRTAAENRYEEFRREAHAHFIASGEIEQLRARVAELAGALREMLKNAERDGDTRLAVQKAFATLAESAAPLPMREDPRYRGTDFRSAIDTTP